MGIVLWLVLASVAVLTIWEVANRLLHRRRVQRSWRRQQWQQRGRAYAWRRTFGRLYQRKLTHRVVSETTP